MIPALVVAAGLGAGGREDFRAAFPGASVIESSAGGRLKNAFGFEATGLGDTPEAAARAFLTRYGASFGIDPPQELITRKTLAPGQPGAMRFERQIDGFPVFDGDVVVGVNGRNGIMLVNASDVPAQVQGRARISRAAAIRATRSAFRGLQSSEVLRAERGWRAARHVIRPVWRVEFTPARPPGDWRCYVDAETAKVLLCTNLRADAAWLQARP